MKLNIEPLTTFEIDNQIIPMFEYFGFVRVDEGAIEHSNIPGILVIWPHLLSYENVIEIWYKCKIEPKKEDIELVEEKLIQLINAMPLKPFSDEDAYKNNFSKKAFNKGEFAFFLNPSYRNGYWSNHAIADE